MNAHAQTEDALHVHWWKHRILLVFTPRLDDERARALDHQLNERACDLDERDLLVGRVPASGDAHIGASTLAPVSTAQLRRRYGVDRGEFAVVLIGKDGGEKLRTTEVPPLDEVFDLIDAMPMRIAEMRERGHDCPTQ